MANLLNNIIVVHCIGICCYHLTLLFFFLNLQSWSPEFFLKYETFGMKFHAHSTRRRLK